MPGDEVVVTESTPRPVYRADGVVAAMYWTFSYAGHGASDGGGCAKDDPCKAWGFRANVIGEAGEWDPVIPAGDRAKWNGLRVDGSVSFSMGWMGWRFQCNCENRLYPDTADLRMDISGLPGGEAYSLDEYWTTDPFSPSYGPPYPGTFSIDPPIPGWNNGPDITWFQKSWECGDNPPMPHFVVTPNHQQFIISGLGHVYISPLRFNDVPDFPPMPIYPETPPTPPPEQELDLPPCGTNTFPLDG